MEKRSWNNSYCIGVRLIDKQHERLFDIYDQIVAMDASDEKYQDEEMRSILHELERYLKENFESEEEYLKQGGFPNVEEHIIEHQLFMRKVDEFILSYKANNPYLLQNMLDFLRKWAVTHVMQTDSVYKKQ